MPSQYVFGNTFRVVYPDFPGFQETPSNIRLIQKAGHQDVVELQYYSVSTFYQTALKPGSLIKISWSNGSVKGNFFGQVLSVNPSKTFGQNKPTLIKAIGTALSLKQNEPKIWNNKRASEIVQEIAKKFKLKPIIVPTKAILTQESMVGQTYWQKLRELADKSGYVFHVFETELYFLPFDTMINKFMGNIPVLSLETNYGNGYDNINMSTLLEFNSESQLIPPQMKHSNRTKNVVGIDPLTGKFFSQTKSPGKTGKSLRKAPNVQSFSEHMYNVTVGSKVLAETRAKAAAELSRFNENAKGQAQGDPRVAPYKTVHITGTGVNTDGFWIIKTAEHYMTHDGRYLVDFTCMTDGSGSNKESSFRKTPREEMSVRNVSYELAAGLQTTPSVTQLNAKKMLISEADNGLEFKQRRWVGR